MLITGSTIFIEPDSDREVLERLKKFPEVTFHVQSEAGTEMIVNLEADDHQSLERICCEIKERIPQIIEISHIYVNFEEEVEKIARE